MAGMPKTKKSKETRRQLLDAALSVISRKGYTAATVDEIVSEAGVSKGVAYYHFKSKSEIAGAVLLKKLDDLRDQMSGFVRDSEKSSDALVGMLNAFAAMLYDDVDFTRFLLGELWRDGREWSEELHTRMQGVIDMIAVQLRRGQNEGLVRTDLDPDFDAVGIVGMVVSDAVYFVGGNSPSQMGRDDFTDRIFDFVRNAIAVEGSPA